MSIQELLRKRFATKKFDPTKKVSEEDVRYILECCRLSCSSVNIQPWHVTVVTNPELRKKLREASYDQPQVTDASHLLVLSVVKDPLARIQQTADLIEKTSGSEDAEKYMALALGFVPKGDEQAFAWLARQGFLGLQAMILAAMDRGIDSCPMEGFLPDTYAEMLSLQGVRPIALLTIGYALELGLPKIRVPKEEIVSFVP